VVVLRTSNCVGTHPEDAGGLDLVERSEDGAVEPLVDAVSVALNCVTKIIDALQVVLVQRILEFGLLL
jgi:hypothetical protein